MNVIGSLGVSSQVRKEKTWRGRAVSPYAVALAAPPGPISPLSRSVELVVSEQLVPQLPHPRRQPLRGHFGVPRLDDLEQNPLSGRLQLHGLCCSDRLNREHDREASVMVAETQEQRRP
jgi:hypothetical protein